MWEPSDPFPSQEPMPAVCLGRWASGSHPERCMPVAGRGLWGGVPIQFLETSLGPMVASSSPPLVNQCWGPYRVSDQHHSNSYEKGHVQPTSG